MSIIINALKIIFLLGFLIFIHEGGHFIAARIFKVKVEEFSIGFGPKIFTKKGKETNYSISLIPFGGYVKMTGEAEKSEEEGSFNKAKLIHRIAIVANGPIVNIIFGIIVYFVLITCSSYNSSTIVAEIIPEASETMAEIQVGDKILQVNDKKIRIKSDIEEALENNRGEEVSIQVLRDEEVVNLSVTPIEYSDGVYILGIQMEPLGNSISERLYNAFWKTVYFSSKIGDSMIMLFTGNVGIDQMSGPIGISNVIVQTSGLYDFVYLIALISMSLGVTNLLPIPALDGGRVLLLVIEGIRRKPLKEETEIGIQSLSFTLLILLSIYVSYNDIIKIF